MTEDQIERAIERSIRDERRNSTDILKLINLAEACDLPLKRGFASTFDWLTRGLAYSSSAAHRRLQSARLMSVVPEAELLLAKGEVNLTTLAKAQTAIRTSERAAGGHMDAGRKAAIVAAIKGQTSQQVEGTLLTLLPETATHANQERATRISEKFTRLVFNLGPQAMDDLAYMIDYLSHVVPDGSLAGLFTKLLASARARAENRKTPKARRQRCEYRDTKTGRRCGNTFMIEVDHVRPKAKGGGDEATNLRCLCRNHNQMMSRQNLGREWANRWRGRPESSPDSATPADTG